MTVFLSAGLPPEGMTPDERKRLTIRSRYCCLLKETFYHKGADEIWRRAIWQIEKDIIMQEAHYGVAGGHYVREMTTRKIWNNGLWWPTTIKDAIEYCRQCDLCQRMGKPNEKDRIPHEPVLPLQPFQK